MCLKRVPWARVCGGLERFTPHLRRGKVADAGEAVASLFGTKVGLFHLPCQPVLPVAAGLEAKGRPGRKAQVGQAELRIEEVSQRTLTSGKYLRSGEGLAEYVPTIL